MAAARGVDVRLLKAGYYRYAFADVRKELAEATTQFRGLVQLAAEAGVVLAYHNHSGYIGAPVWDALGMIAGLPAGATGLYFDVRHATVEGGEAGWRVATQMAAPHLRMLAAKDFYWDKGRDGRWRVVDCPIGEGMVDWKTFAAEIRKAGFTGPISLHVEYEPGGRTPAEKTDRMREAAARDRARLAALLG
jgi:sugar phosphate isomerase/epimerase